MAFLTFLKLIAAYKLNVRSKLSFIFLVIKRKTFVFLFFFYSSFLYSQQPNWDEVRSLAQTKKLYENPEWLRLLHYECGWFGCSSLEDGNKFLLDPKGKKSPKAELLTTIEKFASNEIIAKEKEQLKQTAICQYPARLSWIAKNTGDWNTENLIAECKELQEFLQGLEPSRIELVFSSYYLNNPSSAFGHTLLKIPRKTEPNTIDTKNSDLLSYGINYAANPTTANPILYAIYGLVGGFRGTFAKMPYYYKVREYNDFESRDLWEYELDLSNSEGEFLIKHLWELGQAEFDYYYLTENCSYYIMRLLNVAAPQKGFLEDLWSWVIPIDTIKSTYKNKSNIKNINYRPSLAKIIEHRFSLLNKQEQKFFHQKKNSFNVEDAKQVPIEQFDLFLDYFDYNNSQKLVEKDAKTQEHKHQLLIARSKIKAPTQSKPLEIVQPPAPHLSHPSLRVDLGYRLTQLKNPKLSNEAGLFGIRFAHHDYLEPSEGMPVNSRLEMFSFLLSIDDQKKYLHLDRARFVGIESLNSLGPLWYKPSWSVDLGADRITDNRCSYCLATIAKFGIGIAKQGQPINGLLLIPHVYLNARGLVADFRNDKKFSYDTGVTAGIWFITSVDLNFGFSFEPLFVEDKFSKHLENYQFSLQKTWSKEYGLRINTNKNDNRWQIDTSLVKYF